MLNLDPRKSALPKKSRSQLILPPAEMYSCSSGTRLRSAKPSASTVSLKNYAAQTRMSSIINPTGRFNSELKRTGFLGDAKMRAKRIAQNPKRFLEAYANSAEPLEFVPTEVPELESFIEKLNISDHYAQKDKEFRDKAEAAKNRTFLLSMASASSMDLDTSDEFLHAYSIGNRNGDGDYNYNDPRLMKDIVGNYLDELKSVNTEMIEEWLTR